MSKSSKGILEAGGERKRGHDKEPEHPIFCEKCLFVFQGENEFKTHACLKKDLSVSEVTNKKTVMTLDTRKGRQAQNKVILLQ